MDVQSHDAPTTDDGNLVFARRTVAQNSAAGRRSQGVLNGLPQSTRSRGAAIGIDQ